MKKRGLDVAIKEDYFRRTKEWNLLPSRLPPCTSPISVKAAFVLGNVASTV